MDNNDNPVDMSWIGEPTMAEKYMFQENKNIDIVNFTAEPAALHIQGDMGELVTIQYDGTITFGENYNPDEAAQIFWKAIATWMPTKDLLREIADLKAQLGMNEGDNDMEAYAGMYYTPPGEPMTREDWMAYYHGPQVSGFNAEGYDPLSNIEDYVFPHPSDQKGSLIETLPDDPLTNPETGRSRIDSWARLQPKNKE